MLRYVSGSTVNEKLFALVDVSVSSSSEALFQMADTLTLQYEIPLKNMCIADSFDGASSMSGTYNGLQAKLKALNPNHVHTWCYSHVLNLVISGSCGDIESISFFNLLQVMYNFFSESYKRMASWETLCVHLGSASIQRLTNLGNTRWRAKHNAVVKIFDTFDEANITNASTNLYAYLVICLDEISNADGQQFNAKTRAEARALCDNLLKTETIFVAFVFLRVFKYTTPLSDYLQTRGLNYVQAWRLVSNAREELNHIVRDFSGVEAAVKNFVIRTNVQLKALDFDAGEITSSFPEKTLHRRKRLAGETGTYETFVSPLRRFEVEVHNRVLDAIIQNFSNRFDNGHGELYRSFEIFDPRNFSKLTVSTLANESFDGVQKLIPSVDIQQVRAELIHFAQEWPTIRQPTLVANVNEDDLDEEDCADVNCSGCCFIQVVKCLWEYNFFSSAYANLFCVYKTLLTLPMTQVRILINRLRLAVLFKGLA
jgi:hypothetical protein